MNSAEKTQISEELSELIKCGVAFHHAGLVGPHRKIIEDSFKAGRIKVLTATPTLAFGVNLPARTVIIQDYRRFEPGYGNYLISVLDYKQMAGRAGRPKYDKEGESILIAKTSDEADYLMEGYILAKPERIWSRLNVEKIIRGHVLATIASDFAHSEQGVFDFFGKTFYAYQYDVKSMRSNLSKILKYLYEEEMICVDGNEIYATKFGKRISELYIDPMSGVIIRNALKNKPGEATDFGLLHLIAHTPDMGPVMRPYAREIDPLALTLEKHRDELFTDVPNEWQDHFAFEEFLGEIKTATVMKSWIEEITEERLIQQYNVQPGDLYRIIENAKWLLHATDELAGLFGDKALLPLTSELVERVSKGIKKELLPLTRLEGVGRVRGRIMFDSGFQNIDDLRLASIQQLTNLPTFGPRLAKKIKEQVGGYVKKDEWEKLGTEQEFKQKALGDF
jgi:helicase